MTVGKPQSLSQMKTSYVDKALDNLEAKASYKALYISKLAIGVIGPAAAIIAAACLHTSSATVDLGFITPLVAGCAGMGLHTWQEILEDGTAEKAAKAAEEAFQNRNAVNTEQSS